MARSRYSIVLPAILLFGLQFYCVENAYPADLLETCNAVWTSQSTDSSESMPVGGGDIGLNVWVQDGELLFYIARSGAFDENNEFLKLGRVRLKLSPNPFDSQGLFQQELKLRDGYIEIKGTNPAGQAGEVKVWVEVFRPVIHVEVNSDIPVKVTAAYESWRNAERELPNDGKNSRFGCFGYDAYTGRVATYPDTYEYNSKRIMWYHRNKNDKLIFDLAVKQQGLEPVKDQMWNPLKDLTFGGLMTGTNMVFDGTSEGSYIITPFKAWKLRSVKPARNHELKIFLHTAQTPTVDQWKKGLNELAESPNPDSKAAFKRNISWWRQFWDRSYIFLNPLGPNEKDKAWQIGRNYQLFRYMLGCNAYGDYPTKFNGGLFTYDPGLVEDRRQHTPDWRAWGGGSFTAQNQRLLYWPMLKSGDSDMMNSQFDFYRRALGNATLRVKTYWGHGGCCFTEQMSNFGLPIAAAYGWSDPNGGRYRPPDTEFGVQANGACRYHYNSQLEFSFMILNYYLYAGKDISSYMPFIERSVRFFDEHYQYRCKQLTGKPLDDNGCLVIYPSTSCESYKGARNPSDIIAGLRACTRMLIGLPDKYLSAEKKQYFRSLLGRIPPFAVKEINSRRIMQPAESWLRYGNCEIPQFYPIFPFGLYGVGKPDLQMFIDTWRYGDWVPLAKSHISWHQNGIFFARMGLTEEAAEYNIKKLENSGRRFPAFWGPGHDWVPDHNWGGSGMIGLQEMLMQTDDETIYLFPAWPKDWDVNFKLHAPYQTVVQGVLQGGKIQSLKVTPPQRKDDIQIMLTK
ncbi:MAG: DUF5703 domain-containing protein [Planctomycetota bacterium]